MADEQELEKKAVEELLKEAKRGKVRAETMGPAGWVKCPLRSTNKRFLLNTLRNTFPSRGLGKGKGTGGRNERDSSRSHHTKDRSRKQSYHPYKQEPRSGRERDSSPVRNKESSSDLHRQGSPPRRRDSPALQESSSHREKH
ncbi:protein POLR1D-like [Huso huso]|uniref:Protein POLR1D-like n=1 Tax=Huso huso TaxID=61971 RepID=A0ABR0ZMZ2_HUSHU